MLNPIPSGANLKAAHVPGDYSKGEHQAMQRAIIILFAKWRVKDADAAIILGGISTKRLQRWRDGDYGRVTRDLADRLSNLLGIHKALRIIFSDPQRGYDWMSTQSPIFGDQSALDLLLRGGMEDLIRVRRYLDSVRGGW
ncbi:MAG: MbcA/ParS/Xre antitoxin family protein [Hyphomicrobiaceae bacterium]